MIVLDVDGTLLNDTHDITPRTKNILIQAQKKDIVIVIATGRQHKGVSKIVESLQMKDLNRNYIIALNGQQVFDIHKDALHTNELLRKKDLDFIFKYGLKLGVKIIIFTKNCNYEYKSFRFKIKSMFTRRLYQDVEETNSWTKLIYRKKQLQFETCNKIAFVHQDHILIKNIVNMKRILKNFNVFHTKKNWIEIMPRSISKEQALDDLCKVLKIHKKNIVAFGDGENDIGLLRYVGYGVAMGNANETVKKSAKFICADHNHDGIADTLEMLFKEELYE